MIFSWRRYDGVNFIVREVPALGMIHYPPGLIKCSEKLTFFQTHVTRALNSRISVWYPDLINYFATWGLFPDTVVLLLIVREA